MKYSTQVKFNDEVFDVWEAIRSRVGRRKRVPNIRRRQAAKNSWKMTRRKRQKAIDRYHKSPAGKRMHRNLGRFNKNKRGRNQINADYERILPFVLISISEHLSWLVSRTEHELWEEVYDFQDIMSEIIECPKLIEDFLQAEKDEST